METTQTAVTRARARSPTRAIHALVRRARELGLGHRAVLGLLTRRLARAVLDDEKWPVPEDARLFRHSPDERELDALGDPELAEASRAILAFVLPGTSQPAPEALGLGFERLLALHLEGGPGRRKRTGTFFTPPGLAHAVVRAALERPGRLDGDLEVCDPACGAGAFLLAAARELLEKQGGASTPERRKGLLKGFFGVDLDALAIGVTELALWMFVGERDTPVSGLLHLGVGNALTGPGFSDRPILAADDEAFDWAGTWPSLRPRGFDWILGNPPWVAYAGRATQPIPPELRAFFSRSYQAFRGYPTLHAMFVERAAELAPGGVVSLVLPSPIADLDGYRFARAALCARHAPCEPMLEFGQDAFSEVVQPCFALVAEPRSGALGEPARAERPWQLMERARAGAVARAVEPPRALGRLSEFERLPTRAFAEMGLQTTGLVTRSLLHRGSAPAPGYSYPLLEGREIREFFVGPPRLFLRPDAAVLSAARCRLRPAEDYRRVELVVRQTAVAPIAAMHSGLPFRNTLLAGFSAEGLPAELLVGLLNSSLFRALHLSTQRDGRQAAFPQVKLSHLRALPAPPAPAPPIIQLVRRLTDQGLDRASRLELDRGVFALFSIDPDQAAEVVAFLRDRAPALSPPL